MCGDEAVATRAPAGGAAESQRLYFDLGGAYEQLDRSDEALASYEKTVALRPDFVEAQTQLGSDDLSSSGNKIN